MKGPMLLGDKKKERDEGGRGCEGGTYERPLTPYNISHFGRA